VRYDDVLRPPEVAYTGFHLIGWDIELIPNIRIAYFGGKTEETKQNSGGDGIAKAGFVF
jgi:hypothetical protein